MILAYKFTHSLENRVKTRAGIPVTLLPALVLLNKKSISILAGKIIVMSTVFPVMPVAV